MKSQHREGETIKLIREAVRTGKIPEQFRGENVNMALRMDRGGNFWGKHSVGNGHITEHFVRIDRGLYRLKSH